MKTYTKHFSLVKAKELQETAKTVAQAEQRFENSCNLCDARNCENCPVKQKHEERVVFLKSEEAAAKQPKRPIIWETTRSYNISPLNQKVRSCLQMIAAARRHSADYSTDEYVHITTYEALLKRRDYPILKAMMVHNGHFKKGRQKVTAITPIVNKLKEIIKEVF